MLALTQDPHPVCVVVADFQHLAHAVAIDRTGKEIALAGLAVERHQLLGLRLFLDALSHDPDPEAAGDIEQALGDHAAAAGIRQTPHEALVDLDDIDGDGEKMCERGKAGAEIIERDLDPGFTQGVDLVGNHIVLLGEIDGFRHLRHDRTRGKSDPLEGVDDAARQPAAVEIGSTQVQPDPREQKPFARPVAGR